MAACGSLQPIFDKPLPETPPLLESISPWNQLQTVKSIDQSSFTEIFGELHFEEDSRSSLPIPSSSSSSSSLSFTDLIPQTATSNLDKNTCLENEHRSKNTTSSLDSLLCTPKNHQDTGYHRNGDSFSPRNYESLQLCTEGLGFESFDDVEDLKNDMNEDRQHNEEKASITRHSMMLENQIPEIKRSRMTAVSFPPPISCIGQSGKPWISFKSYRHGGRFVLKQVRIPSQEFLHAQRADGCLKLHFVQPSDEIFEEEEAGGEENCTEDDEQEESEETGNKEDQE